MSLALRRSDGSPDGGGSLASVRQTSTGPRAFVVGAGDRVDLAVPSADALPLLPRHISVVAVPKTDSVLLRVASLHPERGLLVAPVDDPGQPLALMTESTDLGIGGVVARDAMRLVFDGYILDVHAALEAPAVELAPRAQIMEVFAVGQQLSFYAGASVKSVGDAVSSVAGPGGGGHAVPALVHSLDEQPSVGGTLVLRTRIGVHRVEVSDEELRRGMLIGRSRRCVLGRGFDENDGLSRVHALVLRLDEGVFAFDLASRYGLRDVSRPSRLQPTARLDDGVGCLVYGAGYLTFEG